jgi:RNA polymerase sigma-70 factor (ECF subfamily)
MVVTRLTVTLFDELRAPVYRYVLSLGLSPHDADEVAQETFLRLHRHLSSADVPADDGPLRGWVFRVAQNLAHDQRRRAIPRAAHSIDDSAAARQAVDQGEGPEQRLLTDERTARVQAAMQALPARQQQCLRLRAEGLRYREIAQVLDVGVSTVADLVHQALAQVRRQLRQDVEMPVKKHGEKPVEKHGEKD